MDKGIKIVFFPRAMLIGMWRVIPMTTQIFFTALDAEKRGKDQSQITSEVFPPVKKVFALEGRTEISCPI